MEVVVANVAECGLEGLPWVIEFVFEFSNLKTFIVWPLFKQLIEAGLELQFVQGDSLLGLGVVH